MTVHDPNTEVNTEAFDPFTERDALVKLTGDSTIDVFIGSSENTAGMVLVQYWAWRGRPGEIPRRHPGVGRIGFPREYVCQKEFYHRDRVAEMLRLDREAA